MDKHDMELRAVTWVVPVVFRHKEERTLYVEAETSVTAAREASDMLVRAGYDPYNFAVVNSRIRRQDEEPAKDDLPKWEVTADVQDLGRWVITIAAATREDAAVEVLKFTPKGKGVAVDGSKIKRVYTDAPAVNEARPENDETAPFGSFARHQPQYNGFKELGKLNDWGFQALAHMGQAGSLMSWALTVMGEDKSIPKYIIDEAKLITESITTLQEDLRGHRKFGGDKA